MILIFLVTLTVPQRKGGKGIYENWEGGGGFFTAVGAVVVSRFTPNRPPFR